MVIGTCSDVPWSHERKRQSGSPKLKNSSRRSDNIRIERTQRARKERCTLAPQRLRPNHRSRPRTHGRKIINRGTGSFPFFASRRIKENLKAQNSGSPSTLLYSPAFGTFAVSAHPFRTSARISGPPRNEAPVALEMNSIAPPPILLPKIQNPERTSVAANTCRSEQTNKTNPKRAVRSLGQNIR